MSQNNHPFAFLLFGHRARMSALKQDVVAMAWSFAFPSNSKEAILNTLVIQVSIYLAPRKTRLPKLQVLAKFFIEKTDYKPR
ncbi:hypothetical protein TorRG33x02_072250 [Trema orientale]|uniref:Uncharacterized protein n=1 Tax=Trema orientale TaxID=63057 RepID=A0A2P5FGG4_TREOI|nr:hypothetical protein TorRG33x02_072250 [Trema orientale]